MIKPRDPRELAIGLLTRSTCSVRCAAVIADGWGIHSWGANHAGFDGLGQHAEIEAIRRANRKRLKGSTIYVAGERARNSKPVPAIPCYGCLKRIIHVGISKIWYRDDDGSWKLL